MNQIEIAGMSCAHCARAVKLALEELGLKNVAVSLTEGIASFDGDADENAIRDAVADAGFELI